MSTISVRLPDSLHNMVREVAQQDHVSINQFVASAVAEKISALATEQYLGERAQRASDVKFRSALAAVPDVAPEPFDQ
ncbi:MAG: toxin-antitoxin system HicB family antitoxin [Betaproteobacteria bacterium]|uniref:Toxin-antitoxin system HicB family antitoxin n=1 Tax=Candidatus Proximibacter danicus TaxID=2954365 RepID=A0A9D7PPK5_9PROT|nr:toxin-antitoxin system HicB family antitoxin [Candidatus Proximibacter danicus]